MSGCRCCAGGALHHRCDWKLLHAASGGPADVPKEVMHMKRTQRQLKRSGQHQAEVEAAIGCCGCPHLAGSNADVVGQHDKDLQGVMFKGQANFARNALACLARPSARRQPWRVRVVGRGSGCRGAAWCMQGPLIMQLMTDLQAAERQQHSQQDVAVAPS
jgi:hypothetical protein